MNNQEYRVILTKKKFLEHKENLDGFVFHREAKNGIEIKTTNLLTIDYLKQIQNENN